MARTAESEYKRNAVNTLHTTAWPKPHNQPIRNYCPAVHVHRLLNSIIFPIKYSDAVYRDCMQFPQLTALGEATTISNGPFFVCAASIA